MRTPILVSAYAVRPHHGSEPGVGWNWVRYLSNHRKVLLITEAQFQDEIISEIVRLQLENQIVPYFLDIGSYARRLCWNQGDWRFYFFYQVWQIRAFFLAKRLISSGNVKVVHQLNMIGFREPGYLWLIKETLFVWGPVGGVQFLDLRYARVQGFFFYIHSKVKNALTYVQAKFDPRVRAAARKAAFIFTANRSVQENLSNMLKVDSTLINETGLLYSKANVPEPREDFQLLWVGRFIPSKMLTLSFEIVKELKDLDLTLKIVGTGTEKQVRHALERAAQLGVSNKCSFAGSVSHNDVQIEMRKSKILLFTSIYEGTPHVVLEAISNSLPVFCFDLCGQGDLINPKVGVKIKLSDPATSVKEFADSIRNVYFNRSILKGMAAECDSLAKTLTWEQKARQVAAIYASLETEVCLP